MKNIITCILLIFLFSCSSSKDKEKLIGNWYAKNDNNTIVEFQFSNDSLIIYDEIFGKYSQDWEINKDKIHLTNINGFTNKKQLTYSYRLDNSNELLNLEVLGDTIIQLPELRKAKNAFDFFKKIIDLEIELPKSTSELKNISQSNNLNFNIYAGFKHNNLVVKTDFSPNLNNLNSEVNSFRGNKREELKPFLRFNLITDKNISEFQLDSIKNRLKETSIERIVRTYKNDQTDYEHYLNWFVQKE
jgi:hypothetical protein